VGDCGANRSHADMLGASRTARATASRIVAPHSLDAVLSWASSLLYRSCQNSLCESWLDFRELIDWVSLGGCTARWRSISVASGATASEPQPLTRLAAAWHWLGRRGARYCHGTMHDGVQGCSAEPTLVEFALAFALALL